MFGITNYWVFVLSGILLNLTPGPDTLYILGRSISQGKKAGVASALGISSGCLIHTLLAAFGLSVILAKSAFAFNLVKFIGAAYLVYLGIRAFISKSDEIVINNPKPESNPKIYLQGIVTNVFNPKVALFFLAFLPQFVTPANQFGPWPFVILGITFITTGTLWCLIVAYFAAFATGQLRQNQRISSVMNKLTGLLFISLGLNLIRSKAST